MNEIVTKSTKPSAYAWWVFTLAACFLFYKYILQISPAVMTNNLMQTYSLTGTALGFLVGFYFYTYMVMQIPSGILLDRFGVRRLASLSIFLCAIGTLIFSQTSSFPVACLGRLLVGFGAAFATTSYMKLAAVWFPPQYFPLLSGLFGTACMAGAGTAEAPLALLVNHVGWRNTLLICALIGFALLVLFWIFVRDKNDKDDSLAIHAQTTSFNWRNLFNLFRSKSNWGLLLYGGLSFTPASVFGGLWGVPFIMTAYHLSKATAASAVSLIFFGFALGGIFIGWLGKRMDRHLPAVFIGTAFAFLFMLIVLYVPHLPLWLLSTCIFMVGFSLCVFMLSYAIARNTNSVALVATVIGVINMGDPLCGAIAEPLIGKILDLNWDGQKIDGVRVFSLHAYHLGLSVLAIYLFLALICCAFIKEEKIENLSRL